MLKKKNIAMTMAVATVATSVAPAFAAGFENKAVISTTDEASITALKEEIKGYLDVKYTEDATKLEGDAENLKGKCAYKVTVGSTEVTTVRELEKELSKLTKLNPTVDVKVEDLGHKVVDGEVVNWKTTQYKKGEVVEEAQEAAKTAGISESDIDVVDAKTISLKLQNNDEALVITEGNDKLDFTKVIHKKDAFDNFLDKDGKITTKEEDKVVLGFEKARETNLTTSETAEKGEEADKFDTKTLTVKFGNVNEKELKANELFNSKVGSFTAEGNELVKYIRDYNEKSDTDITYTDGENGLSLEINVPKKLEKSTRGAADYATIIVKGTKSEVATFKAALVDGTGVKVSTIAGTNRQRTAIEVSKAKYDAKNTADAVVLVSDYAIADGLAATPFAAQNNAPILLTGKDGISEEVMAEIQRVMKAEGKVYLIGGDGVLGQGVEKALDSKFIDFERIAGKNRQETSLEIARHMRSNEGVDKATEVFVTGGYGEADAMSIANIAAEKKAPILLVNQEGLTTEQARFVKDQKDTTAAYIVGGSTKVPTSVDADVKGLVEKDAKVTRLAGERRQETNAKVINEFATTVDKLYVAKSDDKGLVDALPGGVLAAEKGSIVVLATDNLDASQEAVLTKLAPKGAERTQIGYGIATKIWEAINKLVD